MIYLLMMLTCSLDSVRFSADTTIVHSSIIEDRYLVDFAQYDKTEIKEYYVNAVKVLTCTRRLKKYQNYYPITSPEWKARHDEAILFELAEDIKWHVISDWECGAPQDTTITENIINGKRVTTQRYLNKKINQEMCFKSEDWVSEHGIYWWRINPYTYGSWIPCELFDNPPPKNNEPFLDSVKVSRWIKGE